MIREVDMGWCYHFAMARTGGLPGRPSLFPGKKRERVLTFTVTDAHLAKLDAATTRLGLTRSDLLGLLVDRYAAVVEIPPRLLKNLATAMRD